MKKETDLQSKNQRIQKKNTDPDLADQKSTDPDPHPWTIPTVDTSINDVLRIM